MDDLLGTRGQLDTGLALIGVVADNGDVVAGGAAQSATVTNLLLDVGNDGTLGHGAQGQDVADGQGSLLSGVDELAGVHAFVGNEGLGHLLESVGVTENDLGEGSTATCSSTIPSSALVLPKKKNPNSFPPGGLFGEKLTRIVDDVADDTADVAVTLGIIEVAELGRSLVQARVGRYTRG